VELPPRDPRCDRPTVVGTSVLASLNGKGASPQAKAFIGKITVLAAVLASIQTFTKLGEGAQQHGTAGDWYAAMRRDMEQVLQLPVELRPAANDYLDRIRKEMNVASQKAPELGERWWIAYEQQFGDATQVPSVRTRRPWWLRTPLVIGSKQSRGEHRPAGVQEG
jgi:hypothetical protein